jgi:hypothetical protein
MKYYLKSMEYTLLVNELFEMYFDDFELNILSAL